MSDGDPFSAWSARRRKVAEEEAALRTQPDAPVAAAEEPDEATYLADNDLRDPDELSEGDDFAPFMKVGVPAALKRRALRRLWRLNPVLANVDGLVEYGEDYTDAATVVENLQTAYEVGKGFLKTVLEEEPDADVAPPAREAEVAAEDAPPAHSTIEIGKTEPPQDLTPSVAEKDEMDTAPPTRRRMAFRYDDDTVV